MQGKNLMYIKQEDKIQYSNFTVNADLSNSENYMSFLRIFWKDTMDT